MFEKMLKIKTPCCGRSLAKADFYSYATTMIKRTCNKCGKKWFITIVPIKKGKLKGRVNYNIHSLEWKEL